MTNKKCKLVCLEEVLDFELNCDILTPEMKKNKNNLYTYTYL